MNLHPKTPVDLALAPVAAGIDLNLQELRDLEPDQLNLALQLANDRPPIPDNRAERATQVLRAALRNVELHGWDGSISDDGCRLHLSGGSVTLDLGLGATIMSYIEHGVHVAVA
jgi:hypothetical protein